MFIVRHDRAYQPDGAAGFVNGRHEGEHGWELLENGKEEQR